jgi:hypothetical protein
MHPSCSSCGALIQADGVNPATSLAWCRLCQAMTNLAAPPGDGSPTVLAALSAHLKVSEAVQPPACRPRERVPQPNNVRVRDCGNALEIRSRLRRPWAVGNLMLFCIIWDLFLIVFVVMWCSGKALLTWSVWPILLHFALGGGLTYYLCGIYLNRTVVRADSRWVRVWHRPLPWRGRRRVARASIQQLYCCWPLGKEVGFDVMALLRNRRRVLLVRSRGDRDEALFIEQTLEDYIGIADSLVSGELPR